MVHSTSVNCGQSRRRDGASVKCLTAATLFGGTSAYGFNFRPLENSHWLHASSPRHIAATTAKAIHGLTSEVPRKP